MTQSALDKLCTMLPALNINIYSQRLHSAVPKYKQKVDAESLYNICSEIDCQECDLVVERISTADIERVALKDREASLRLQSCVNTYGDIYRICIEPLEARIYCIFMDGHFKEFTELLT